MMMLSLSRPGGASSSIPMGVIFVQHLLDECTMIFRTWDLQNPRTTIEMPYCSSNNLDSVGYVGHEALQGAVGGAVWVSVRNAITTLERKVVGLSLQYNLLSLSLISYVFPVYQ